MRIRILRQTSIDGQPARAGDVLDVADTDAGILLAMGKAEQVQDSPHQGPDPVVITEDQSIFSTRKPRGRKAT